MRVVWMAVLLGSFAVGTSAGEVSFAADIVPLFKSRCVVCHLPGSEQGGLALHPKGGYANLVNVKSTESPLLRVAPGNAEESYLYRKLTGTHAEVGGNGQRMPFGDASLTAEEIERVRLWIAGGAKP